MPALSVPYWERLQRSFAAVYAALEVPRTARRSVFVLLVIHTVLLAYSAYVHSPTLNEPGHLAAGLSHWKFGRFELYRVNPPLVRMVAALPVMAVGYNEDWSGYYEGPGARPEMGMGENFVAANGERSFFLFMIARWACIPFSWLGAIVCYLWARDLYGRPSGVMAAAIWCFEPNILAHASLITADSGATALGLAACYTFWRWLKQPTWTQAALTGVVLGLAELAKTTLILFYPLWPLMWIIYRVSERRDHVAACRRDADENRVSEKIVHVNRGGMTARDWLREAGMLALRMIIGLYVLNLGYGFEGSFKQLKEFHFVSDLFTGSGSPNVAVSLRETNPHAERENYTANRFTNTWLGDLPVPFPKNYLLGIDIQQYDFEHYGRPSYLRGQWRDRGWWYYYLYATAIKVPLGLWANGVFALIASVFLSLRERPGEGAPACRPRLRDEFILIFPALVIFTVVSAETGFSEHMRYVLPAFPFAFVWISQIARLWEASLRPIASSSKLIPSESLTLNLGGRYALPISIRGSCFMPLFSTSLVSLLTCWMISSSLWIYPHSLSYFNESIGGPLKGPEHLLGSNVDWGQDLRYVAKWLSAIRSDQQVGVACHGHSQISSRGFDRGSANRAIDSFFDLPKTCIVSVSLLYNTPARAWCGNWTLTYSLKPEVLNALRPLDAVEPIGYTHMIFRPTHQLQED